MSAGLVVLLSVLGLVQGSGGAASAKADEDAIRGVIKMYLEARERGDARAVRELFTEDADQLTSSGEWRKGRDNLVAGAMASSKTTTGTRTITIETIRFPAPDVAVADGRYEIAGNGAEVRRMWASFFLVRQAERWRITAIRNMLPAR